jgi:hypothetical protein
VAEAGTMILVTEALPTINVAVMAAIHPISILKAMRDREDTITRVMATIENVENKTIAWWRTEHTTPFVRHMLSLIH